MLWNISLHVGSVCCGMSHNILSHSDHDWMSVSFSPTCLLSHAYLTLYACLCFWGCMYLLSSG